MRPESRTRELARTVLETFSGEVEELRLYEERIPPLTLAALKEREKYSQLGDYSHPDFRYAKQFAAADGIVIAAPYWDLLFPAVLRIYLEAVTVAGITFRYTPAGIPEGLCRAEQLVYVTTAGGPIGEYKFGFDYVKALATLFYGISDVRCVSAEGLDILGADSRGILEEAKQCAYMGIRSGSTME